MKSRKLTADELSIKLTEADISSIPFEKTLKFPVDSAAAEAIASCFRRRGRGLNIFVAGPAAAERLSVVSEAAKEAGAQAPDLVLIAGEDAAETAEAVELPAGTAKKAAAALGKPGPEEFISEWTGELGEETAKALAAAGPEGICVLRSSASPAAPVTVEHNPVPERLFGRSSDRPGRVRAGSLIESCGGLLILSADDLLLEEESWIRLKRVLRSGTTWIGGRYDEREKRKNILLPEIRADFKVAILGTEQHYDHFYNTDEDFRELFPFFAELDSVTPFSDESLALTVNHFRTYSEEVLGRKLTDGGALEAVKYSIADAENKNKLSTTLSDIDLILTEAAGEKGEPITSADICGAIGRQSSRFGLLERRILEDIESGEINLKVDGREVGKVNGLAVIDKGPYSFGFPGLISARIAPGENGLVNIEHEAGLSGEIHDKWVLILEGFLRSRFALDFPISIFASLCFEQSYSEIDGDSASSSELYALLSAISGIPVRQDIAVTGSLSQTGEIQAVGGLREKIEGFYKACRTLHYTGTQGVIVPEKNIKNIILPDEIINEVREGRFHIYPVSTVNDSMEILTEMEAGSRNSRGIFPHGTLNHQVEKNLRKLAQQVKGSGH